MLLIVPPQAMLHRRNYVCCLVPSSVSLVFRLVSNIFLSRRKNTKFATRLNDYIYGEIGT